MGRSSSRANTTSRVRDRSAAKSSSTLRRETSSPFKEQVGPIGDAFEREADRMADAVVHGDLSGGPRAGWSAASAPDGAIQRKCAECEEEEDEQIRRAPKETAAVAETDAATPEPASAPPERTPGEEGVAPEASQRDTAPPQATPGLLVDDESEAGGGQMRKAEFLRSLRAEVCAAVDGALSGTGRDSQGCPWIDHWLGYYEGRTASQLERSLRRYAPEAATVAAAQDYIPIVAARVRTSAETFAKTGDVTGMPAEVPDSPMPGGDVLGAVGGMFFKARPGGARDANPVSVRDELGSGQSFPSGLRTRMESAFGADFGGVRLHTDAKGNQLSDRLNARAFTVGQHVAFGPGEFRPGTIAGDALIAHELAHVLQQQGGTRSTAEDRSESMSLELDANRSAEHAVRSSLGLGAARASARLRTGLRLQRCSKDSTQKEPKVLQDFAVKFADAAALIRKNQEAMKLVVEAQAANVEFGGFSEDGPAKGAWAYTVGNKVYVPKARTDAIIAMSDFLFELNNAIRAPKFAALDTEAAKGAAGTLTARDYARKKVEQEVEGMLRLGEIWFEIKKTGPGASWDKYDRDFFLAQYNDFKANRKTKDDIVNDVLKWKNGLNKSKTNEQFYMDQYGELSSGK